jgi:hypothetical protein
MFLSASTDVNAVTWWQFIGRVVSLLHSGPTQILSACGMAAVAFWSVNR